MIVNIKRNWFIYAVLAALTLVVYSQVMTFPFVSYDDGIYVTNNAHIRDGITPSSLAWALTGKYEANWIPLTWVSYMLDHQVSASASSGEENASTYHRTNLLLHVMSTLLLFLLLGTLTGSRWRSALVAAIFAVHPLHVESVAWVAERKDVLSTFFMMLTLLAYVSYVRRPGAGRYILTMIAFVLGLMSKSMLVTLPVLLLLLDFWPLKRVGGSSDEGEAKQRPCRKLLVEKLPFFAAALVAGVVTVMAQEHGEAVRSFVRYPMGERLANGAVSYLAYIGKTLWPTKLACFYPHPHNTIPIWEVAGAVVALAVLTFIAIRAARRLPQVAVGWLWYLVTLVPVIGIVQVGAQGMADRYMYVPMIGLSIAVVWGVAELVRPSFRHRTVVLGVVSCLLLVCLMVKAHSQVGMWKDDIVLFTHAIDVTSANSLMQFNLADSYLNQGDSDQAAEHFRAALDFSPNDAESQNNLAMILLQQAQEEGAAGSDSYVFQEVRFSRSKIDEADEHFRAAVRLLPNSAGPHRYLACVLMIEGKTDEAIAEFRAALRINPDSSTQQALQEALANKQAPGKAR